MPALFRQCAACSWLKVLDSSDAFIMKFVVLFLVTIIFGALGGKKEHSKCSWDYYRFFVFNFISNFMNT